MTDITHERSITGHAYCGGCGQDWPCQYEQLRLAAKSILWMAREYAEGGGLCGPEMRDYIAAAEIIGEG